MTREMEKSPVKSEMKVFHELADSLTKVQHQLHCSHHDTRFLRYQLLVAAAMPHLRHSLVERIPSTPQEAMQRIATLLSSDPRSVGAHCIQDFDKVNYGLGRRFGGGSPKQLKGNSLKIRRKLSRKQC